MRDHWRLLQPLRVAAGWRIDISSLYAVDPSPESMEWFHGSVLISGNDDHSRLSFDARWEPEGDPEGCYTVDFLRLPRPRKGKRKGMTREGNAGRGTEEAAGEVEFIGTWTTRNRPDLVAVLESFMFTRTLPENTVCLEPEPAVAGPDVVSPDVAAVPESVAPRGEAV
ncbi:hypothetical protein [Amycolatopsis decaplanina]|uniref:Uncharacterized protein n=1 Tax=Amycolatopsis decaplanina DSM 44594 TaxID=1284240 RepID=M2YUI0_9PSEU|nr:hypothetical protein [Amycolatopsis decaplanina]EME52383.1 hypothetical protein H074_32789 [Amycolatopsis decaplanina DSM 44594]